MHRTGAVDQNLLGLELLTRNAIPALVLPLEDVAALVRSAHHLLYRDTMTRLGGADEVVE
jgi:hypothetical protein